MGEARRGKVEVMAARGGGGAAREDSTGKIWLGGDLRGRRGDEKKRVFLCFRRARAFFFLANREAGFSYITTKKERGVVQTSLFH